MAVHEHGLGAAYSALVPTSLRRVPLHTAGIVQQHAPWRRGRAVLFPIWPHRALALGIWRKRHVEVDEDFEDAVWLDPAWLSYTTEEISGWKSDEAETAEASGERL